MFHVLPYFSASRNMIMKILLERMADTCWYLESKEVVELVSVLRNSQIHSHELMQMLGRWLNTKIHAVDEDELQSVVKAFGDLGFVNGQVISALERYVKIRLELIESPNVLAVIMDYCAKFKVRSSTILENVSDYFIAKGNTLSPAVIKSLFVPFGTLHYTPTRSYEFWKTFEQLFEDKFTRFEAEHVVDILLSCLYLEKYPINFVNYVFNPYFLTRLQNTSKDWKETKIKLATFDHYMNTDCASYRGPLLPQEMGYTGLVADCQLMYVLNRMKKVLRDQYGDQFKVYVYHALFCCPQNHSCAISIYMTRWAEKKPRLAILVHTNDDYTYGGETLSGAQQLRSRHFANLGLEVVNLDYSRVIEHCTVNGSLNKYMMEVVDPVINDTKAG